jgi:hypothetical protein
MKFPNAFYFAFAIVGALFFRLLSLTPAAWAGAQDTRSVAIDVVKRITPHCEGCTFFALPHEHPLIKKHALYFVSTVDLIPSPKWVVAVDKRSFQPYPLNPKELTHWNKVIREEKLRFKSDSELQNLAKMFLELAAGQAIFIEQLLPGESDRIQRKTLSTPNQRFQSIQSGNIFSISFYAKDLWGALQAWDLTVEPAGTILKAEVREY